MTAYETTLISLPPGEILIAGSGCEPNGHSSSPHRHPEGQILGSLRGLLSVGTDRGVWIVPAIHAVWFPPHHMHWVRSHGPMEGWTVYVAEDACGPLPQKPCTIRTSGLLREAVLRAATWLPGPRSIADDRVAQVILDEIGGLPIDPFGLPLPDDPRLLRVAQALIENPSAAHGIAHWATLACVSERTLSRRFVEETGFNFTSWRQRARLLRSLEMLAQGQSVTTIALDLGYSTASAFIALFHRVFGETPALYRAKLFEVNQASF